MHTDRVEIVPGADRIESRARGPKVSLIVVLPENHVVSAARVEEHLGLSKAGDVQVVVACAGQPSDLGVLHRAASDAQFLLAPSGTSAEDLRELAMRQVAGDIVRLLAGTPLTAVASEEVPLKMMS